MGGDVALEIEFVEAVDAMTSTCPHPLSAPSQRLADGRLLWPHRSEDAQPVKSSCRYLHDIPLRLRRRIAHLASGASEQAVAKELTQCLRIRFQTRRDSRSSARLEYRRRRCPESMQWARRLKAAPKNLLARGKSKTRLTGVITVQIAYASIPVPDFDALVLLLKLFDNFCQANSSLRTRTLARLAARFTVMVFLHRRRRRPGEPLEKVSLAPSSHVLAAG